MQHARKQYIQGEIQPANPLPIDSALNGLPEAANRNERPTPVFGASVFPAGAVARIYRPARSAMTSGRARTKRWLLRFDRRTPPFIEPLMGWTGGDDTLTQIELSFPTSEAAVAYARRQGLTYVVDERGMRVAQHRRALGWTTAPGTTPPNHPGQGGSAFESEAVENGVVRPLVVGKLPTTPRPRLSQCDP